MSQNQPNSSEITFNHMIIAYRQVIRFLFSKWKFLIIVVFAGCTAGFIYQWLQSPKYEAVLTFSTEEEKTAGSGSLAGLAAQFGLDIGGASSVFSGDNILPLIQSRKIIEATLLDTFTIDGNKQSLLNMYLDFTKLGVNLKNIPELKDVSFPPGEQPETFSRKQDSILLDIISKLTKGNISADRPDKKVGIFVVICTSPDEVFSKKLTEGLINKVSEFYIENKTKRSRQTVDILQKTADSLKNAYDAALSGRAYLADENINPVFQSPIVPIQKKQTDITVIGTAYGEVVKNLEIAKYNLLKETPLITVIDSPLLPLKNKKASRLLTGLAFGFVVGILSIFFLLFREKLKNINEADPLKPDAV